LALLEVVVFYSMGRPAEVYPVSSLVLILKSELFLCLPAVQGDPFEMFNSFFGGGGGGGFPGGGQWTFNMGGGGGGFNMGGGGGGFPGGMGRQRAQRQASGNLYDGDANIEKLTSDSFPTGPQDWVWLVSGS
jgi:hypothetical protein